MPKSDPTFAALNRTVGRAIHQYDMIADGDRLAVGLSGGKDSQSLLWMLHERLARAPVRYTLVAIYVDPGFPNRFDEHLSAYCRDLGVPLVVVHTDHGPRAHRSDNRENPCFLCSRWRRRRLFELAEANGCRKLALGHHKDDLIETLMLNMCFAGEISTMKPVQSFFNGAFTIVRPLALSDEGVIARFARKRQLPVFHHDCPSADQSRRHMVKGLLRDLYRSNRKIRGNLFRAMHHVRADYLL